MRANENENVLAKIFILGKGEERTYFLDVHEAPGWLHQLKLVASW